MRTNQYYEQEMSKLVHKAMRRHFSENISINKLAEQMSIPRKRLQDAVKKAKIGQASPGHLASGGTINHPTYRNATGNKVYEWFKNAPKPKQHRPHPTDAMWGI